MTRKYSEEAREVLRGFSKVTKNGKKRFFHRYVIAHMLTYIDVVLLRGKGKTSTKIEATKKKEIEEPTYYI